MKKIIRNPTFKIIPQKDIQGLDFLKTIELIQHREQKSDVSVEEMMKEINERGFISAPPAYLLGLEVQYPRAIYKYKRIVSLDYRIDDRFSLIFGGRINFLFFFLHWLAPNHSGLNSLLLSQPLDKDWWYAVIPKPKYKKQV